MENKPSVFENGGVMIFKAAPLDSPMLVVSTFGESGVKIKIPGEKEVIITPEMAEKLAGGIISVAKSARLPLWTEQ